MKPSVSAEISRLLIKTHDNFLKVGAHFAGKGDLQRVTEILKQRPEWIHTRGSHGRTMLWEAVNHNRQEMLTFLLEAGADIHAPGCHFSQHFVEISPYCLALVKGNPEMAAFLKSKGAVYDIFTAAYVGDLTGVIRLSEKEKSHIHRLHPLVDDTIRASLMHYAVAGGNPEIVRFLAEQGAEIKSYSYWLLCFAFWKEAWDILEILVAYGADTSLWVISDVLPLDIQKRVLEMGFRIDYNHPNEMGWPPLVYACRGDNGEHPEEVEELLAAGANIHATNLHGRTALHTAAKAGFSKVIQVLLAKGAEVDRVDKKGDTALFVALASGIKKQEKLGESIEFLLKKGANLKHVNNRGKTLQDFLNKSKNQAFIRPILARYGFED